MQLTRSKSKWENQLNYHAFSLTKKQAFIPNHPVNCQTTEFVKFHFSIKTSLTGIVFLLTKWVDTKFKRITQINGVICIFRAFLRGLIHVFWSHFNYWWPSKIYLHAISCTSLDNISRALFAANVCRLFDLYTVWPQAREKNRYSK